MLDRLTPEKYTPARSTPERYEFTPVESISVKSENVGEAKAIYTPERYIPHIPQITKKFKPKLNSQQQQAPRGRPSSNNMVGGDKKYRCTYDNCTKVFDTSGKLYRHKFYVHKDKVPCPYRSEGCTSMLKPHSVESHVRQVHEKVQVTCSKCGKVMLKDSYYLHKRLHFKDDSDFQTVLKTAIDAEMSNYYSSQSMSSE